MTGWYYNGAGFRFDLPERPLEPMGCWSRATRRDSDDWDDDDDDWCEDGEDERDGEGAK